MNNKSIIWRNEALAAIATSYNPSAERAKEVLIDAQLAVMGLPEAALNVWKWHPYPEEKPVKGENKEYRGNYLIWTEGGYCTTLEYHYGKDKWNVTDNSDDNEFKDVIAWAEIVPYRRRLYRTGGRAMDLIDRQAAMDVVKGIDSKFVKYIEQLPSAQPELIRCKDCKHRPIATRADEGVLWGFSVEFPDERCPLQCEDGWYNHYPKDDFYCANAERRTDECD